MTRMTSFMHAPLGCPQKNVYDFSRYSGRFPMLFGEKQKTVTFVFFFHNVRDRLGQRGFWSHVFASFHFSQVTRDAKFWDFPEVFGPFLRFVFSVKNNVVSSVFLLTCVITWVFEATFSLFSVFQRWPEKKYLGLLQSIRSFSMFFQREKQHSGFRFYLECASA